jgi:glc operon protein GlcG
MTPTFGATNQWGEDAMRRAVLMSLLLGTAILAGGDLRAQQPAPPNLDAIPDKMPFDTPYGPPIGAQKAQAVTQAAAAEASKRGWALNIAVIDSGGNLVSFLRMDGAQLASIAISQHKARVAVRYRRPTKALEDGVQKADLKYLLTLDDVIASRRRHPTDRGWQDDRSDWLFGRHRVAGRGGLHGWRGRRQQVKPSPPNRPVAQAIEAVACALAITYISTTM